MHYGTMRKKNARTAIVQGFFRLLSTHKFSDITVSAIVKEANVARVTYYRNFYYQEEIIEEYIRNLHEQLIQNDLSEHNVINSHNDIIKPLENAFKLLKKDQVKILLIYRNGFSNELQNMINEYAKQFVGKTPFSNQYQLLLIAGGFLNIGIEWLNSGAKESPQQLALLIASLISKNN